MGGPLGTLEAGQLRGGEVEDATVEEDEGAEGLVERGGREVLLSSEIVEESDDLGGPRSRGWRGRWKRRKARIQWRYASSVRGE